MSAMASRITDDSTMCSKAYSAYNKGNIKATHWGSFVREGPDGFPSQMVSDDDDDDDADDNDDDDENDDDNDDDDDDDKEEGGGEEKEEEAVELANPTLTILQVCQCFVK